MTLRVGGAKYRQRSGYVPTEGMLAAEYLALRANTLTWQHRQRLGDVPELQKALLGVDAARRFYKVKLRWIDGIVWEDDAIVLLEAKQWLSDTKPLYQLLDYKGLFKQTPRYAALWSLPLKMEIVAALYSPDVIPVAKGFGIRCVIFRPAWILPRLKSKFGVTGYEPIPVPEEVK